MVAQRAAASTPFCSPSCVHTTQVIDQLEKKGATLRILAMNLDTPLAGFCSTSPDRSLSSNAKSGWNGRGGEAKSDGKYKERAPTARAKSEGVVALYQLGAKSAAIAREMQIASVYLGDVGLA